MKILFYIVSVIFIASCDNPNREEMKAEKDKKNKEAGEVADNKEIKGMACGNSGTIFKNVEEFDVLVGVTIDNNCDAKGEDCLTLFQVYGPDDKDIEKVNIKREEPEFGLSIKVPAGGYVNLDCGCKEGGGSGCTYSFFSISKL